MGIGTSRPTLVLIFLTLALGCDVEVGPGSEVEAGPYGALTPNDAWLLAGGDAGLSLTRHLHGDSEDELAYLVVTPFGAYLDDEDWVRELGLVGAVQQDLEGLLRREVEARAEELEWETGSERWDRPTIGVLLRYSDQRPQLYSDRPARCFNEIGLVLTGSELHLWHAYGYEDHAEALAGELDSLRRSLTLEGRGLFPDTS